jgi:hypothetical protein
MGIWPNPIPFNPRVSPASSPRTGEHIRSALAARVTPLVSSSCKDAAAAAAPSPPTKDLGAPHGFLQLPSLVSFSATLRSHSTSYHLFFLAKVRHAAVTPRWPTTSTTTSTAAAPPGVHLSIPSPSDSHVLLARLNPILVLSWICERRLLC